MFVSVEREGGEKDDAFDRLNGCVFEGLVSEGINITYRER